MPADSKEEFSDSVEHEMSLRTDHGASRSEIRSERVINAWKMLGFRVFLHKEESYVPASARLLVSVLCGLIVSVYGTLENPWGIGERDTASMIFEVAQLLTVLGILAWAIQLWRRSLDPLQRSSRGPLGAIAVGTATAAITLKIHLPLADNLLRLGLIAMALGSVLALWAISNVERPQGHVCWYVLSAGFMLIALSNITWTFSAKSPWGVRAVMWFVGVVGGGTGASAMLYINRDRPDLRRFMAGL